MLMKSACLDWLRFQHRCPIVATEVGVWSSDVMGINTKGVYEIEIKVSETDFMADFRKHKHRMYEIGDSCTPDYFYFCVTKEIESYVTERLQDLDSPYGVLVHSFTGKMSHMMSDENTVTVRRQARKLNTQDQNRTRMESSAMLRMGSELCRAHHWRIRKEQEECTSDGYLEDGSI